METKKVAKEYLQKDILRTIFQMWYSFYTTEYSGSVVKTKI